MEPWHPDAPDLQFAIIPVILAVIFFWVAFELGHWDQYFVEYVEWVINGVMGLWGE
ncbi:MAG: hypothetical protein V3V32_05365 [Dehalococcoidia bacterium]